MSSSKHTARAGGLVFVLALLCFQASPRLSYATPTGALSTTNSFGQREGVSVATDGTLTLSAQAPSAPAIYGPFERFGIVIAPPSSFARSFSTVRIDYDIVAPSGSTVRFDVRASTDGIHWGGWESDLASGSSVVFHTPAQFAQYRATLLANGQAQPVVHSVRLIPQDSVSYQAMEAQQTIAPTYRLRGTREGLVGRRTANGHRITPHDHFVSLPSWRSLSSKGGNEYMVRITYKGRSSVAPVYDVGPWNVHDNYWDVHRERFDDLPRGWPEDHAAYYDKYNNGMAEKGRVRFPTAIDVGDGVWWDDLGIRGDQAEVEVTFLWLGRDPLAPTTGKAPPAPEQVIPPVVAAPVAVAPVEAPPAVVAAPDIAPAPVEAAPVVTVAPVEAAPVEAPPTIVAAPDIAPAPVEAAPVVAAPDAAPAPVEVAPEVAAPPVEAMPIEVASAVAPEAPPVEIVVDNHSSSFKSSEATWYRTPKNCDGQLMWTYTTPTIAHSENVARWQPILPSEGRYDVYVAIPACNNNRADTGSARYEIHARDHVQTVTIDQSATAGTWVLLGRFPFAAGEEGFIELSDVTNDSMRTIWYDSIKWVLAP